MKKSVRLMAAVMGVCMLCGCTAKETKTTRSTKATSEVTESESSETTESESESASQSESESASETSADATTDDTDPTADSSATETSGEDTSGTATETSVEGTSGTSAEDSSVTETSANPADQNSGKYYESFLKNEATLDVSYLQSVKDDLYGLEMDGIDFPDREMTCKEFLEFLKAHSWQNQQVGNTEQIDKYAIIDCGQDGDPELLVMVSGMGEFTPQIVIKAFDGKLKVTAILESWSRSSTQTNMAGCIFSDGAGGAALHYTEYGYLNEKGEVVKTVSIMSQFGNWSVILPIFDKMEEYLDSAGLPTDYYMMEIKWSDSDKAYYSIATADNSGTIDPELQILFDQTKVDQIDAKDVNAKIIESVGESRYNAPAIAWKELK